MLKAQLNQAVLHGGQRLPKRRLGEVLNVCAKALRLKSSAIVSIAFVSERDMRNLNKTWRGNNRVTDVLSFELDENPPRGEILLSYEQAARQAKRMKHSIRDELWFLVVHGVLHVFGYDHERPKDAKKMFALQEKILTSLGIDSRL